MSVITNFAQFAFIGPESTSPIFEVSIFFTCNYFSSPQTLVLQRNFLFLSNPWFSTQHFIYSKEYQISTFTLVQTCYSMLHMCLSYAFVFQFIYFPQRHTYKHFT